jgi:hypothetical protein
MMFYTDDPIRDAERHQAWQDSQQESDTIGWCEHCGEPIYAGEDYYEIYGEIIHEDCLRDWAEKHLVRV